MLDIFIFTLYIHYFIKNSVSYTDNNIFYNLFRDKPVELKV